MAGWEYLFNTWEVDRVIDEVRRGNVSVLAEIAEKVIPGIEAYCRHIDTPYAFVIDELRAGKAFREICEHIVISNDESTWSGPTDDEWRDWTFGAPSIRAEFADSLEKAWFVFIAECAGPAVYIKQPAERKARAKGAAAKAESQRAIIAEARERFDPGNESGLSNSRRAEMILSRAHAAKAKGEFAEADRLPSADRLRRYLGSKP